MMFSADSFYNNRKLAQGLRAFQVVLHIVLFGAQTLAAYFLVIVISSEGQGWQVLVGLIALALGAYIVDRLVLERWAIPDARGESEAARLILKESPR